ncbi:DUF4082 domain-containing protein [Sphaerisporangium rhizosphaerae]|uniref:DUF4082 domain-containing protein n=1 Tax=Sphaerisporangium rhizosphaerae TaxID=2269375 RepID=A0ABW2NYT6_9ACTN
MSKSPHTSSSPLPSDRPRAGVRLRRHAGRACLAAALSALLTVAVSIAVPAPAGAAQPPIPLGDAASFGVLAGTAVSNTNQTAVTGDLGVSPGSSVVGFPPGTVSGSTHAGDAAAAAAVADAGAAYDAAAARTPIVPAAAELGATTKPPGVYSPNTGSTFQITGTLTLDAQDDPDALFIFRAATLTTANVSNIALINGAQADNVFWQISGSATLGTTSTFRGNVLAADNVTVSSGAAVFGRVVALGGTAVLQGTTSGPKTRITVPNDPPTTTALSTSANPTRDGQSVTYTATVSQVSGTLVPQGRVAFKDGDSVIGSDFVDPSGVATFTTSALPTGQHPITGVYLGGDTSSSEGIVHFAPSTSNQIVQTVTTSIWAPSDTPAVAAASDGSAVTLGVKFQPTSNGTIRGVRFYKGSTNTGTHVGGLWTTGGTLLASATFSGETASGWQQVNFSTPVAVTAGTTYIASYFAPSGHFSYTLNYFTTQHANGPLVALADGVQGGNGVYGYSATSAFPSSTYQSANYWVDVVFVPAKSLWAPTATPAVANNPDSRPVVLGVKFQATTAGVIEGIRFYKGLFNNGTHTVSLWTAGGTLLASATASGETASGWQQANFSTPVSISADTTYVASYHTTSGFFSNTTPYFTSQFTSGSLIALLDGQQGGNGVYAYNATNTFPTNTHQSSNYWVDVVFTIT